MVHAACLPLHQVHKIQQTREKEDVLFSEEKTLTADYSAEQQPSDSTCFTDLIEQTGSSENHLSASVTDDH